MYVSFLLIFKFGLIVFPAINDDEDNHQEQVRELIKQTAGSIDDLALKMLFISVQQNNLEICIEYAVNMSVTLLIYCSFDLSFYFRNIFEHTSTVVCFHLNCRDECSNKLLNKGRLN